MKTYSMSYTVWKGVWTWLQTLGVVGAADVLAVEWPETWTRERALMYLLTVLPAVWRALENWRKNSGPGGLPRWEWGEVWGWALDWVLTKLGLTLALMLMLGCVTAQTDAAITQVYQDGTTETVTFRTSGRVLFSRQEVQRGDMGHFWEADGSGQFTAGGTAERQSAESALPVLGDIARPLILKGVGP